MLYRFSDFVLDADRDELRHANGRPIELQPKVLGVLRMLLEHAERTVTKDELLDAVWPGVATTEGSLTRAISLARHALGDPQGEGAVIQTVWGRGYRIGVPVVAMEPEPPRASDAASTSPEAAAPVPLVAHWRLWALAGGVVALVAGLGVLLARPVPLEPPLPASVTVPRTSAQPSIAVLPFADLSPDGRQDHFADGLAEEVIHALSQVAGLRVLARTSSFRFQGSQADLRSIGSELAVAHVLEGSVRREGERVRIRAQLVQVADGFQRWSRSYDRRVESVFAVQDEIAREIVRALREQLDSPAALRVARPPEFRAYEHHLKGLQARSQRSRRALDAAIVHFDRALAIDPRYAEAHAERARAYALRWTFAHDQGRDGELLARAEAAARRALALERSSAAAHVGMGVVSRCRQDWTTAESEYRSALELNPGYAGAHHHYATLLMMQGRLGEARGEILRALELDPLSPVIHRDVGRLYLYEGDPDRAVTFLLRSQELNPREPHAPRLLWTAYLTGGREAEAGEAWLAIYPPWLRPLARMAGRIVGARPATRWVYERAAARRGWPCISDPAPAAQVLAYLGEPDLALQCLEEAATKDLTYAKVEPLFAPYHEDPRFVALLEGAGLAPPEPLPRGDHTLIRK